MKQFYKKMSLGILAILWVANAFGQDLTVSGTVTDSFTGDPIAGVNVIVKGTSTGTITDRDGVYRVTVPDGGVALIFSFIGYVTVEFPVSASTSMLDVGMEEDITNLEEVVVTGLASSVKRSNLANSVASISSEELSEITSQQTLDAALYGKFKGASIVANSGAPGGGIAIKLRGITSISGSNEPLIILDGVYIDNSSISGGLNVVSAASGGGNQSTQDNASNRLADIDTEDIESIEILKGASAAAIYGSRASGGVIIITTKKGKAGRTNVTFKQSVGSTWQLRKLGVRTFDAAKVTASFGAGEVANFQAAESAGQLHNYEDALYGNKGLLLTSRLSVSGGNNTTKVFMGVTRKDDEGIVANTGYKKNSIRVNIDHRVSDWLDIALNTNYVNSSADRGFFNNDNSGNTMGIAFVATPTWAQLFPDADGNYPNNPYAASNFLQTSALITNNESVNRFIIGGSLTAKIVSQDTQGLRLVMNGGVDYYTLNTTALFPNTLQFQKDGNGLNGVSIQGNTLSENKNFSAFLVHDYFPAGSNMSYRTQVGILLQDFDRNTILGTASNLNGSQTNLDQAGSQTIDQTRILQQDKGFFIQEEVNYRDAVLFTLGVRGDKSSNNGDPDKLFYYPKASLAVNIHELTTLSSIDQLKLRAAFGQAGNFAVFGDKFTSLNGTVIDGNSGLQIDRTKGNSEVEPERQSEIEFGFDLGILNNKIAFDATYYIKTVTDLLLTADEPTSSGYAFRVTNAADLENKGFELGVLLNLVNNSNVQWTSRNSFWTNKTEVTRLDVPSFTTGGFADFLGQYRIKEGHSPTEIIGVGPNPDEDGLVVFGNAQSDFDMSFYNTLTVKGIEFFMLWHWKQGGEAINLTALLSDLSGTSHDYDEIDLDPAGALGNGDYRLSVLGVDSDPYIENAGYVRMREVGLYYNIPASMLGNTLQGLKFGVSGNNLINVFDYRSYDPEVSNFGDKGLSTGVEVTPFPSSKRMNFHVIFKF